MELMMDQERKELLKAVARGVREASEQYAQQNPDVLGPDGRLHTTPDWAIYWDAIRKAAPGVEINKENLEWALQYLQRRGCIQAVVPFIASQGSFGLSGVDPECLASVERG
jgi:hypothetical protein